MFRSFLICIVITLIISMAQVAFAAESRVFTLWPLVDYRADDSLDYSSFHVLGPLIKYETKAHEKEYAFRPLFYRAVSDQGASLTEILYPLSSSKGSEDSTSFQFFKLFSIDTADSGQGHQKKFYLFPFLFYGDHEEYGKYFAFFPVGGKLHGWFGRDKISFGLFPLYSQTHKGTRRVDNVLWPFFARISGENESGYKFWPIYGQSQKAGHYRKRFVLWPIFASQSLGLNTDDPTEIRAAWPFYFSKVSPNLSYRSILWPFFSKRIDYQKEYREWYAPWPLVRVIRGENHHGNRFLPFYADETMDARRQRWYLWPIYKIEELQTEQIMRRRDRVLFFLYSDLHEVAYETGREKRRVALWPLFQYERVDGVSHFSTLALLEPFFPDNDGIERSWAPLWRIYQQKWDRSGNHVVSLLWNLYWRERRADALAWELFPLIEYRQDNQSGSDVRFLKGLFHYRSDQDGTEIKLFYLPWGITWSRSETTGS